MNERDLINIPNTSAANVSDTFSGAKAKSFSVRAKVYNFGQYKRTVEAYFRAGMTFKDIADAGKLLGDEVESQEIVDVPLKDGWQSTTGEIIKDENKILAWQTRKEVSPTHRLNAPVTDGREVVTISSGLTSIELNKTLDVIEGIEVSKQDTPGLSNSLSNVELESNPYLRVIPEEFKKAA